LKNSITPTITPVLHKKVLLYAEIRTERRYQQVSNFSQEKIKKIMKNILKFHLDISCFFLTFASRFFMSQTSISTA